MCNCEYRVDSEFFDWVTGCDDYLYESELWNHCRIQTTALGGERTGEDDDVKSFSAAHELEYRAADSEIDLRAKD